MDIVLKRKYFTEIATIGELSINGVFECFILEHRDRGLNEFMTLDEINKIKKHGETAIPYGVYKVVVTKSERFSKMKGRPIYLPLLLNVKGFEGIRIHAGNKPKDTEGCQLPGRIKGNDSVFESTIAFNKLNEKINNAIKRGEIVTYQIIK